MYVARFICVSVVAFCVLGSVESALTREQMEKTAKGLRNSCIDKINVDPALVEGLRRGEFADDRNLQCYTNCIMKKIRTFKNGALDVDMIIKQIDAMMPVEVHEPAKAAVRKCGSLAASNDDPCLLTYNYVKCTYETAPEVFFFP